MSAEARPLRRLVDLLGDLVDERVGVIQALYEVRREPGAPQFFHYAARASNTAAFSVQKNFCDTGGAAINRDVAIAKAVGEAIERYCSALFDVEDFPLHAAEDAPFRCVDPKSFALYSEAQYASRGFPWVPFDSETTVRWTPATELTTGETVHVPAAFVWIPYNFYRASGDSPIIQPISTGLACHCSAAEAAVSALNEVVERDAFTLMWQGRMSMPQIRTETLSEENYDLVQRLEAVGDSVTLIDITNDIGIPSILSIARGSSPERAAFVFAASSDLSPETAARKALEELAHTRRYSQQLTTQMPRMKNADANAFESVVQQVDHLNLYCGQDSIPLAEFSYASKKRKDFGEIEDRSTGTPEKDVRVLTERLAASGHTPYLATLTSSDIAPLGLHVVRAVVPGLHPLFMGHRLRALGGRRLWEVPKRLGYPQRTRDEGDNPAPHPYP